MSQSQADNEPHGEDLSANPSVPNKSPREVAFSLRDAIEERLKTYNEGLSGTARLYGASNQDPILERNLLLRDITTLNNMVTPCNSSIVSLAARAFLLLVVFSIFLDFITPKNRPFKSPPFWVSVLQSFGNILSMQLYGTWICHQLGSPRVQATLENIQNKVMNKELISPEEMATLKKWYWNIVFWQEPTPDV